MRLLVKCLCFPEISFSAFVIIKALKAITMLYVGFVWLPISVQRIMNENFLVLLVIGGKIAF